MLKSTTKRRMARAVIIGIVSMIMPAMGSASDVGPCNAAPLFDTVTVENEHIALDELVGKRSVYLKFWLSSCPLCIAEMPHFTHAYEQYGDEIQFLAVNLAVAGDTIEVVRNAITEHGLEMPVTVDDSGSLQRAFGVIGTPTHILIDKTGRIVYETNVADNKFDQILDNMSSR